MARTPYTYPSGERALANGTRYGLVGVNGPSGYIRSILKNFSISLKGGSPTSAMVNLRLMYAPGVTVSGGSSITAQYGSKSVGNMNANAQTTAYYGFTIPSSGIQILHEELWHPQAGAWEPWPWDKGQEPDLVYGSNCLWLDALASEASITAVGRMRMED